MDIAETTRICKAIATIKPAQAMSEETPAFWSLILADVRYEDARQAVMNLAGRNTWIGADDVLAEVKAIRRARLEHADRILPDVDPDDVDAWIAARREAVRALGDGAEPPPATPAEVDPRLRAALPGVFRRPPRPITGEGGPQPPRKAPTPSVSEQQAAQQEAERARQLRALESIPRGTS